MFQLGAVKKDSDCLFLGEIFKNFLQSTGTDFMGFGLENLDLWKAFVDISGFWSWSYFLEKWLKAKGHKFLLYRLRMKPWARLVMKLCETPKILGNFLDFSVFLESKFVIFLRQRLQKIAAFNKNSSTLKISL